MKKKTIVCISCYYKGYDFMDEMKKLGNNVILITSENLKEKKWPWHAIDQVYYMPEEQPSVWNLDHLVLGFSYLMQNVMVDAVVALDDYDVEKAALIRENFRISGMGQTTHRYFRDKLAMRQKAKNTGILVPEFTAIFNNNAIKQYIESVPAPWVLKPRSEASATGIKKIQSEEELWEAINKLGENRYQYLLESFQPGDVYHVDCICYQGEVQFTSASMYLSPPMKVSHEGGVFRTKTLDINSSEFLELKKINAQLLKNFGLLHGATHSEFIRGKNDGKWYFLETSSRVGGAHIPDLVEVSTGINLFREWAKIENHLLNGTPYSLPDSTYIPAGLLISLCKDKNPDYSPYLSEEVVKVLPLDYHIAMIFKSNDEQKVLQRLDEVAKLVVENQLNIIPPQDKPSA